MEDHQSLLLQDEGKNMNVFSDLGEGVDPRNLENNLNEKLERGVDPEVQALGHFPDGGSTI